MFNGQWVSSNRRSISNNQRLTDDGYRRISKYNRSIQYIEEMMSRIADGTIEIFNPTNRSHPEYVPTVQSCPELSRAERSNYWDPMKDYNTYFNVYNNLLHKYGELSRISYDADHLLLDAQSSSFYDLQASRRIIQKCIHDAFDNQESCTVELEAIIRRLNLLVRTYQTYLTTGVESPSGVLLEVDELRSKLHEIVNESIDYYDDLLRKIHEEISVYYQQHDVVLLEVASMGST